jgi:hypothetical protein
MISNFDKVVSVTKRDPGLADYLIKEETSEYDTKRGMSTRKIHTKKKSNTVINSIQIETNLPDNCHTTKHKNTDIQEELGQHEGKDVIFQIDQRADHATARLMDHSTTSGELATRTGGAATHGNSKGSPKLATSSIGVSVEKGKSTAVHGDQSLGTERGNFEPPQDALAASYNTAANTFHADQKGYKFFLANKDRQERGEKFSIFGNTQT